MKRIDIINAVANCPTLEKGQKLKAISFLSSEECKNMPPPFSTSVENPGHSGEALFNLFHWGDTPLKGEFWQRIRDALDEMKASKTKEGE